MFGYVHVTMFLGCLRHAPPLATVCFFFVYISCVFNKIKTSVPVYVLCVFNKEYSIEILG